MTICSSEPTSTPSGHNGKPLDAAQVQAFRVFTWFATICGLKVVPWYEDGPSR